MDCMAWSAPARKTGNMPRRSSMRFKPPLVRSSQRNRMPPANRGIVQGMNSQLRKRFLREGPVQDQRGRSADQQLQDGGPQREHERPVDRSRKRPRRHQLPGSSAGRRRLLPPAEPACRLSHTA